MRTSHQRLASLTATALLLTASSLAQDPRVSKAPGVIRDSLGVDAAVVQELLLPPGKHDELTLRLTFGGTRHTVRLRAQDVRGSGFRLLVDEGGVLRELPTPASVTYRGDLAGEPGSAVAATVIDGQLRAEILVAGETWTVQPATDTGPGMPAAAHLVFARDDVRHTPMLCSTPVAPNRPALNMVAPESAAATGLQTAELAIDADYPFYVNRGFSTTAVQNDITGIINATNLIYSRDVGIEHEITTIIVRTSPTYLTDGDDLLFEFQNRWNIVHNDISRDVAHLFSGRPAFVTLGIAFLQTLCDLPWAYGVSWSDFTINQTTRVGLTAHELGHSWGADHCDLAADCRIMCSFIGACAGDLTQFSLFSISAIESYKGSLGCLSGVDPAEGWTETGDAGDLPNIAQLPVGAGPLSRINGTIDDPNNVSQGPGNDRDLFLIQIDDPATFEARTAGIVDTQLFLFDLTGKGVSHNDDDPTGAVLTSRLTGQFVPGPGLYYLAVSPFDRDPTSGSDEIWADLPLNTERAPDGSGATAVLDGWNGGEDDFSTSSYSIVLTGASYPGSGCASLATVGDGSPGTTLSFELSGADPDRFALLVIGDSIGPTTVDFGGLGMLQLGIGSGIVPVSMGFTDANGDVSISFVIPGGFAPSLDLFGQALTATFPPPPGPPVLVFCTSDVAEFQVGPPAPR